MLVLPERIKRWSGLARKGVFVSQFQPALDTVEPPADIVESQIHRGKIHFHTGDVALDNPEPGYDLVELVVDPVEPIVEPGEEAAQKIQDLGVFFIGHKRIVAQSSGGRAPDLERRRHSRAADRGRLGSTAQQLRRA
jgi:hypothetical protein